MKTKLILAGLAAFSNPALSATHQVTSVADSGPRTLRAAIAAAVSGDSITFAPWLHKKTIHLDSQIVVDKELTINGDIDGDRRPDVRLDGHGVTRMLNVHDNGHLTLNSLILENGSAYDGGAIYNSGWLQINYSLLSKNHATFGGVIYNKKDVTIYKTTLTENTASDSGGAIVSKPTDPGNQRSTVNTTVHKSTLIYNWARKQGGAIKNHGNLTVKTSTLSHNRARSSETGSTQYNRGGAIWTYANPYGHGNKTEIYDSTFVGNQSREVTSPERTSGSGPERLASRTLNGGTIYIENAIQHPIETHASIKIQRTVIANSIGRNCGGAAAIFAEHLWSDDNTCGGLGVSSRAGTDRGDPKLISLDNNGGYTMTHMPMPDSGLLREGGQDCEYTDQRDVVRRRVTGSQLTLSHCDIGSIQHGKPSARTPSPHSIDKNVPDEYDEDPNRLKSKIAEKEVEVAAKQADVEAKAQTIAEKQAEVEAKAATIAEKQAEIDAKSTTIAEKQSEIEEKAATIAEKQADIEAKSITIAEKTAQIATLNGQLVDLNAQLASLNAQLEDASGNEEEIDRLQGLIAEKEARIDQHQARIAELEAPDELVVGIGDAGLIKNLSINGTAVLYASTSDVIVTTGNRVIQLADTVTDAAHTTADGATVSQGWFMGDNGMVQWVVRSRVIPKTNFHVSRWEFSSTSAFGNLRVGIHTDVDIDIDHPSDSALIVGGDGHPNRLLVTDSTTPSEGVSQGLRWLKNARRIGWIGTETNYCDQCSDALSDSRLTGPSTDWPTFTPDQSVYPGAQGYGPMDVAITMGLALKPSAKLASFETTIVGAPNGHIE
ncbi:choice-of-anchor Q domain-containing protein [Thiolapillus sp.]|uniref:choice-of-anchor Q domain-containing protein n=1 Tax=Thiolapillus sp. TaxID=2017437 RepID=UPI003AF496C1